MKLIKTKVLYDGVKEIKNCFVGFEDSVIKYVGNEKPKGNHEILEDCGAITPAFIDPHSHIGMVRSGEPADEDESNEHKDSIYPLVNALHSVYMDDISFKESVEFGVLYSVVLPGSGNIIGGKGVIIKNFAKNIEQAYLSDAGIKVALGYNPRSTQKWKGERPSTRMGAIAMLRENFIKAGKVSKLLKEKKKRIEEVDPITEIFLNILNKKDRLMVHVHKEDDVMIMLELIREFDFNAVANHLCDIYSENVFRQLDSLSIPIIYGPLDSFAYKVELKNESWRNVGKIIRSGAKFSLMSDHPVILQRNLFYTLRHLLRFGLSKSDAISTITSMPAETFGIKDIGQIRKGYKASLTMWNDDPFILSSYPKEIFAEGDIVYRE